MFACPHCHKRLVNIRNNYGQFWACPGCGGRMVDEENINWVWAQGREGKGQQKRSCPMCRRAMFEVSSGNAPTAPRLDVCRYCAYVWFDPDEFEELSFLPSLDQESRPGIFHPLGVPAAHRRLLPGKRIQQRLRTGASRGNVGRCGFLSHLAEKSLTMRNVI